MLEPPPSPEAGWKRYRKTFVNKGRGSQCQGSCCPGPSRGFTLLEDSGDSDEAVAILAQDGSNEAANVMVSGPIVLGEAGSKNKKCLG